MTIYRKSNSQNFLTIYYIKNYFKSENKEILNEIIIFMTLYFSKKNKFFNLNIINTKFNKLKIFINLKIIIKSQISHVKQILFNLIIIKVKTYIKTQILVFNKENNKNFNIEYKTNNNFKFNRIIFINKI